MHPLNCGAAHGGQSLVAANCLFSFFPGLAVAVIPRFAYGHLIHRVPGGAELQATCFFTLITDCVGVVADLTLIPSNIATETPEPLRALTRLTIIEN